MFYQQTVFLSKFSLQELIEKNKVLAGLECSGTGGGGSAVIGVASGSQNFHSRKTHSFSCEINADKAEDFDEAKFITALEQDVEKTIIEGGAKVVESGKSQTNSFYFEYTFENIKGRVELTGKRSENYYNLVTHLVESGEKQAD